MGSKKQALLFVPLIIGILTCIFALIGYFIIIFIGIPVRYNMPPVFRAAGLIIIIFGFSFAGWLFKYRSPIQIVMSTYLTMRNAIDKSKPAKARSRTELLILKGPQRHVRHPLYFAVILLFIGWWLLLDYTLILLIALLFFIWFTLVVIRFEEQELKSLYGEEYEAYTRSVPMIFPSIRSRWRK